MENLSVASSPPVNTIKMPYSYGIFKISVIPKHIVVVIISSMSECCEGNYGDNLEFSHLLHMISSRI
ncbi:hypothetical protein KFK09_015122 [Dendrobium nobile]|uniref:Uncharacterized protein n=1 Tax=Dendrobium nobile TaxID=94219 RepID=A0A8T3B6C6_DENNO|nr:hypothetical protein KFK09_015122 [Dendrobium nobile]